MDSTISSTARPASAKEIIRRLKSFLERTRGDSNSAVEVLRQIFKGHLDFDFLLAQHKILMQSAWNWEDFVTWICSNDLKASNKDLSETTSDVIDSDCEDAPQASFGWTLQKWIKALGRDSDSKSTSNQSVADIIAHALSNSYMGPAASGGNAHSRESFNSINNSNNINNKQADADSSSGKHSSSHVGFVRSLSFAPNSGQIRRCLEAAGVVQKLADLIYRGACKMSEVDTDTLTSKDFSDKFMSSGFALSYGGLDSFFGGLEKMVGPPDPLVFEAMYEEHCQSVDSQDEFKANNYGITTTSRIEYGFVFGLKGGAKAAKTASIDVFQKELDAFHELKLEKTASVRSMQEFVPLVESLRRSRRERALANGAVDEWPVETVKLLDRSHCRHACCLSAYKGEWMAVNQLLAAIDQPPLSVAEFIGARLYTGPLFQKYNAVLRSLTKVPKLLETLVELCGNNRYVTTLHVINSALVKLSQIQPAQKVYRGISGAKLPQEFWTPNEFDVCGGVEFAFMSTTAERRVAASYAANSRSKSGIVFEIQLGMVDRGAWLGWLSQYPHEAEICFGPLTGLQVMKTRVEGRLLIVEVRLNINMSSMTIEQVIAKRKNVVADMCRNLKDEAVADVRRIDDIKDIDTGNFSANLEHLVKVLYCQLSTADANEYNDNQKFESFCTRAIALRQAVVYAHQFLEMRGACEDPDEVYNGMKILHFSEQNTLLQGKPSEKQFVKLLDGDAHACFQILRQNKHLAKSLRDFSQKAGQYEEQYRHQAEEVQLAGIFQMSKMFRTVRSEAKKIPGGLVQFEEVAAPHLEQLASMLSDENVSVRKATADALRYMGQAAVKAVANRLEADEAEARGMACSTLARMGEVAKQYGSAVAELLFDRDEGVRVTALQAVDAMGETMANVENVTQMLGDKFKKVRAQASITLGKRGKEAESYLLRQLHFGEPPTRRAALDAMVIGGQAAENLPEFVGWLASSDPRDRLCSCRALGSLTEVPEARIHLASVASLTSDEDNEIQQQAEDTLVLFGEAAIELVVGLLKPDCYSSSKRIACSVLQRLEKVQAYAEEVGKLLNDPELAARSSAGRALGSLGEAAASYAPAVAADFVRVENEDSPDPQIFFNESTEDTLRNIGEAAGNSMLPWLSHRLPEVRRRACRLLRDLDLESVHAAAVAELLVDLDVGVRMQAVSFLRGGAVQAYASQVVDLFKDTEPVVRLAACQTLEAMGKAVTEPFFDDLVGLLEDSDRSVADGAIAALGHFSAIRVLIPLLEEDICVSPALQALTLCAEDVELHASLISKHLESAVAHDRAAACQILGAHGKASSKFASPIAVLLDDSGEVAVLLEACTALRKIGEAAWPFARPISELLAHSHKEVREVAAATLASFGEASKNILLGRLESEQIVVREYACKAFALMAEVSPDVLKTVNELLEDEEYEVRSAACSMLATRKEAALAYLPSIAELVNNEEEDCRCAACDALAVFGEAAAVYAVDITDRLNDDFESVRVAAASALIATGEVASRSEIFARKVIDDEEWMSVRLVSCKALKGLTGEISNSVREAVKRTSQHQDDQLRKLAQEVLTSLSEDADDAADAAVASEAGNHSTSRLCTPLLGATLGE